jgi:hypothetical protein
MWNLCSRESNSISLYTGVTLVSFTAWSESRSEDNIKMYLNVIRYATWTPEEDHPRTRPPQKGGGGNKIEKGEEYAKYEYIYFLFSSE